MQTVQQLQKEVHKRYLALLGIYRYIKLDAFQSAYAAANEKEKNAAIELINNHAYVELENWVRQILIQYKIYELLDIKSLKIVAGEMGVEKYYNMDKNTLLFNIASIHATHYRV